MHLSVQRAANPELCDSRAWADTFLTGTESPSRPDTTFSRQCVCTNIYTNTYVHEHKEVVRMYAKQDDEVQNLRHVGNSSISCVCLSVCVCVCVLPLPIAKCPRHSHSRDVVPVVFCMVIPFANFAPHLAGIKNQLLRNWYRNSNVGGVRVPTSRFCRGPCLLSRQEFMVYDWVPINLRSPGVPVKAPHVHCWLLLPKHLLRTESH